METKMDSSLFDQLEQEEAAQWTKAGFSTLAEIVALGQGLEHTVDPTYGDVGFRVESVTFEGPKRTRNVSVGYVSSVANLGPARVAYLLDGKGPSWVAEECPNGHKDHIYWAPRYALCDWNRLGFLWTPDEPRCSKCHAMWPMGFLGKSAKPSRREPQPKAVGEVPSWAIRLTKIVCDGEGRAYPKLCWRKHSAAGRSTLLGTTDARRIVVYPHRNGSSMKDTVIHELSHWVSGETEHNQGFEATLAALRSTYARKVRAKASSKPVSGS